MTQSNEVFVVTQIGAEGSQERGHADRVFRYVLQPELERRKLTLYRADLDSTPGAITRQVIQRLLAARLVIADLTGRNLNVYYELGIAHSFGRPVIALIDNVANLPFDNKDQRCIEIGPTEAGLDVERARRARAHRPPPTRCPSPAPRRPSRLRRCTRPPSSRRHPGRARCGLSWSVCLLVVEGSRCDDGVGRPSLSSGSSRHA